MIGVHVISAVAHALRRETVEHGLGEQAEVLGVAEVLDNHQVRGDEVVEVAELVHPSDAVEVVRQAGGLMSARQRAASPAASSPAAWINRPQEQLRPAQ